MTKQDTIRCKRCGKICQAATTEKPEARPFKKAPRGNCAACAVCLLFQDKNGVFALPPDFEPEGLKLLHIQQQFAWILASGGSDLTMSEIDWDEVISKWRLPVVNKERK